MNFPSARANRAWQCDHVDMTSCAYCSQAEDSEEMDEDYDDMEQHGTPERPSSQVSDTPSASLQPEVRVEAT